MQAPREVRGIASTKAPCCRRDGDHRSPGWNGERIAAGRQAARDASTSGIGRHGHDNALSRALIRTGRRRDVDEASTCACRQVLRCTGASRKAVARAGACGRRGRSR